MTGCLIPRRIFSGGPSHERWRKREGKRERGGERKKWIDVYE